MKLKVNKYTRTTKEHPLRQKQKTRTTTKAKNITIKFSSKDTTTKSSKRIRPKSVDTLKLKANKYTQTTKEQPLR